MNREQLRNRFRLLCDDTKAPYKFPDEEVNPLLDEAVEEAVIRARLLHESSDTDVCEIDVTAGTATYTLSPLLYEITHISFVLDGDTDRKPIKLVSEEWLDAEGPTHWRDASDTPKYGIQDDVGLRLVPNPNANGTIKLEGYRLPASPMEEDTDSPEINAAHHRHLVQWPLRILFDIPDRDSHDPERSMKAEREFVRYFGERPDVDLRRITREDVVHHVRPDFP